MVSCVYMMTTQHMMTTQPLGAHDDDTRQAGRSDYLLSMSSIYVLSMSTYVYVSMCRCASVYWCFCLCQRAREKER